MRRIEALTDRSWKHIVFEKFALVREILLSLISLRTVSSYETDSQEKEKNSCFFVKSEKRGKGEMYTDSSYTTDSHANTGIHVFSCQE